MINDLWALCEHFLLYELGVFLSGLCVKEIFNAEAAEKDAEFSEVQAEVTTSF